MTRFLCPLLSTRVYVLVLNDGLHHLNCIVLVSKKKMVYFLDDGARRRHQAFVHPMLVRRWLFREPFPRSYGHLFGWAVVLPVNFPLRALLLTAFGADDDSPSLAFPFPFLHATAALTYAFSLAASISTESKLLLLRQANGKI